MADKEATIYIVDLGNSMGRRRYGRELSDLDWSMKWLEDKLTNTVYLNRKTLVVGIIGLGTDGTDNDMKGDAGYDHISTLLPVQSLVLQHLRDLAPLFSVSKTDQRDALSAIILAVYAIMKHCGKLKWRKQIVLITNGTGPMDPAESDILSTAEQIKANAIDLLILGIDFDDLEYGFKEEDKSPTKSANEKMLRKLAASCDGKVATMAEAVAGLAIPFIKPVRPTPTYRGLLSLGDPAAYDSAITIDIERYFKVAVKRPPAASSYVVRSNTAQPSAQAVETARTYQVTDPSQPGQVIAVEREDLAKGYEYGRTAVHISESDENITRLETDSSYQVLGFYPKENLERYMLLDNTNMLVPQKGNVKAALALSSVVHALYELDSVAVARLVKKDMSEPQLTLLSPLIQAEIECLVENVLPYAEDLRSYRFPPVDRVVTVSGKLLESHRNLPSNELLSAMDEFVDSMTFNDDEEEHLLVEETFSPTNFAIESAIKYRAMHPKTDSSTVPEALMSASQPTEILRDRSQTSLAHLMDVANVKKVPPKVKGRGQREREKPLSGLDIDALFRKDQRIKISPENAIPEFKQALATFEQDQQVEEASGQMFSILKTQIRNTYGDRYDRVIEGLGVMRQELQELEMPAIYNKLMQSLRKQIIGEELGGNRKMLWYKIKVLGLGLIDHDQADSSEVSKQEAENFLRLK